MQLKTIYLIFSILLLSFKLSAQYQITGVVKDAETKEPMPGVSMAIKETQQGTITDDEGRFSISVHHGSYTVVFSYMGYESYTQRLTCTNQKPKGILNISLKSSTKEINEVVVTAKSKARKIREEAMPIAVITMDELQGTVSDVSGILSKTSGVKIRSSGGEGSTSRLSVRGLEGKRIGFFINETALSDNTDILDINDIPIELIERIEIYKGIVPAKLGGSAIGGAVNIVTKEYPPKYMDATYSLGSFNTHKASLVLKRNKNGIEYGGGGMYTYSDNDYRMTTPEEYGNYNVIRDHDKFEKTTIVGAFKIRKWWFDEITSEHAYTFSQKEIQGIEYNIQKAKSYSNAYVATLELIKDGFLTEGLDFTFKQVYARSTYKYRDKSKYTYNWDSTIKDTVYLTNLGIGEGENGEYPNDAITKRHNYSNKLNLNYIINDRNSVNLSSNYRYIKGMPTDTLKDLAIGYETNFNSTMNNWVCALAYKFNGLNKKLSNMLTGKFYYYSMQTKLIDALDNTHTPYNLNNTKEDFGISEAVRFRFTPKFLIKSSIAYDVRLPSDEELLGNGFMIQAAGNLNPERNTSINLGLMYDVSENNKRFSLEINGFCMYLKDMIRFTGGPLQSVYVNFGKMRTLGAEIEIKADATNWLYLWGNATYQDLRDVRKYEEGSTANNPSYMHRMPNIPYLYANVGLELHKENLWGGKGQNTRLFSDCSFVEEYFYDFEMSIYQKRRIPRAFTVNAGLEHSLLNQSIYISFQANNITNAEVYSEFNRPLPGRNYGVKLRYVWK